jgi:hypothetical protein|tara:strand:- start:1360 stop:1518 length:159 start_codon:yes stop_codon:yes gene_type:complete
MGHIIEKCIENTRTKETSSKVARNKNSSILDLKLFSKEEWSKIKAPYINTFG